MEIVVYKTTSLHNVLTRMGASLAEALREQGVDATFYIPKVGETEGEAIQNLAAARTRAVISFGSGGADWRADDGAPVYNHLDCGFIGWDADHPSYNFARFTTPIARRGQICASASHVDFARTLGCGATARLMLPGVDALVEDPPPIAARPIHGMVAMRWIGEPEAWWADDKGTPVYALAEGTVARALADPAADLFAAFRAAAAAMGLELPLNDAICTMIAKLSLFVRQYDRLRLAHALAASGVACAICGDGWRERLGDRPNLIYADSLDFHGIARLYGQARVVFNVNGANGASERAIAAMAAGAMVASDYSPLLDHAFGGRDAIGFYDRRDMAGVNEALALATDVQQGVADRGRQAVGAAHLWSHKAAAIIDMLQAAPFNLAPDILRQPQRPSIKTAHASEQDRPDVARRRGRRRQLPRLSNAGRSQPGSPATS